MDTTTVNKFRDSLKSFVEQVVSQLSVIALMEPPEIGLMRPPEQGISEVSNRVKNCPLSGFSQPWISPPSA